MSDDVLTLQLSPNEALALLQFLIFRRPIDEGSTLSLFYKVVDLADKLRAQDLKSPMPKQKPNGAELPAVPSSQGGAVEMRDRWARDRHGVEVPTPEGCETHQAVHIWKAEIVKRKDQDKTSFLKVAWDSPSGKGSVDAACFDSNLYSYFMAATKQSHATVYTVRNGNYLNLVGIRA